MPTEQLAEILKGLRNNEELKELIDREAHLVPKVHKENRAWSFFVEVCVNDGRRVFGMSSDDNLLPMIAWMRKTFGDPPIEISETISKEIAQEKQIQEQKESAATDITKTNKEAFLTKMERLLYQLFPIIPKTIEENLPLENGKKDQSQQELNETDNTPATPDIPRIDDKNTLPSTPTSDEINGDSSGKGTTSSQSKISPIISKNVDSVPEKNPKTVQDLISVIGVEDQQVSEMGTQSKKESPTPKIVVAPIKYKNKHFREVDKLIQKNYKTTSALDEVCAKYDFNREGFEKMYYKRWVNKPVKGDSLRKGEP